ncbi:mitoguardin-like [Macrosteles quadrilineatus]|uniref:mitoguardin-like n=2 Tax=Macrosteles quadrilineatus TaxID=74068 RepID=UPI0023E2D1A3|nr:mitoguardin-like [Macrosteles quadrilineatus]
MIGQVLVTFQKLLEMLPGKNVSLGRSHKIVIISLSSIAALGLLAKYLRRRRYIFKKAPLKSATKPRMNVNEDGTSQASTRRSGSPSVRSLHRQGSLLSGASDRMSAASGSLPGVAPGDTTLLSPQQLGVMGMEALETSINYWEDALALYTTKGPTLALTSEEEAEFSSELQKLVEAAYSLQEQCELLFLDQRSVLFRADSSVRDGLSEHRSGDYSSPESFVSAQDQVADLREFEEFVDLCTDTDQLPLYQSALRQFEDVGIPYRTLRTEMVHCSSDVEYLCKLHCIRLAFQYLFKDTNNWTWFANNGRQVLYDLLLYADKDTKDFMVAYEEMLLFLQEKDCWEDVEKELSVKGVKAMTFYDVVMDYILMDAFEDLDTPPASVTAVVQNRWLSNGFKESALTTAVWSVLKAKRRMLKYPNGFMAHFYAISEQMSPLMAWGFLGPDEGLKSICLYFREQVMGFLTDAFSFQKTRYTTVEELADDVFKFIKVRVENLSRRLNSREIQASV